MFQTLGGRRQGVSPLPQPLDLACVCDVPVVVVVMMQESNGDVMRLPVMSKKMTMAGELEVTGSISGAGPQASQVRGVCLNVCVPVCGWVVCASGDVRFRGSRGSTQAFCLPAQGVCAVMNAPCTQQPNILP